MPAAEPLTRLEAVETQRVIEIGSRAGGRLPLLARRLGFDPPHVCIRLPSLRVGLCIAFGTLRLHVTMRRDPLFWYFSGRLLQVREQLSRSALVQPSYLAVDYRTCCRV